jgi:peptidoglycan-associated lipoprotein
MRRTLLSILALSAITASGTIAAAQVRLPTIPRIGPRGQPPPPPMTIEMLQADLVAKTGSDMVYFAGGSHGINAAGQTTLVAQARWLLANPAIRARIEGHADERTPRDYALAVGERRADAVRDFLVLQGVQPGRLTIVSWGKERPAVGGSSENALALNRRARTVLVP